MTAAMAAAAITRIFLFIVIHSLIYFCFCNTLMFYFHTHMRLCCALLKYIIDLKNKKSRIFLSSSANTSCMIFMRFFPQKSSPCQGLLHPYPNIAGFLEIPRILAITFLCVFFSFSNSVAVFIWHRLISFCQHQNRKKRTT